VTADPDDPAINGRLARNRDLIERVRQRIEERQGVTVPDQDPDYEPAAEAWPSPWEPWASSVAAA
jgi:hypothetical protein